MFSNGKGVAGVEEKKANVGQSLSAEGLCDDIAVSL